MSKKNNETEQKQLKSYFEEEPITRMYHTYRTDYHKLRITDTRVQTFMRVLGKVSKKGSKRYTDEARHNKMCRFLQDRAKPIIDKMTGEEWEASMRSLFKKIFKEDWDREDFNNAGFESDATSSKIAT